MQNTVDTTTQIPSNSQSNFIEPPPLSTKISFNGLKDWLSYECQLNEPNVYDETSNFRLYKIHNRPALYLVASTKSEGGNVPTSDIALIGVPFQLTDVKYKNLNNHEILSTLESEISQLINGKEFEGCSLRKSKAITLSWDNSAIRQLRLK